MAISEVWKKIDLGLATIYSNYLRGRESGAAETPTVQPPAEAAGRVNVSVHFTTALGELEALGFEPASREDDNRAAGLIDLDDLERLAEHPGVQRISFGSRRQPMLDQSIPNIRANLLRTVTHATVSGAATGRGAIVGIIDTGIDFRHPFFLRAAAPAPTRILRIWDPGLRPRGDESSPDVGLLTGAATGTYGVEYTNEQINAVLRKEAAPNDPAVPRPAVPVRHRDCGGHGTHVASIAAGRGTPPFARAGVAPDAELIVVKCFDLAEEPRVGRNAVGDDILFQDAVTYILNVAATPDPDEGRIPEVPKPVAINYSLGAGGGPHDGFTDGEDWLSETFRGARSEGRIFVTGAGNSGDNRQHARIAFPARGAVEIPLWLYDRREDRMSHDSCRPKDDTYPLHVELWYSTGGPGLAAALDIPRHPGGYIRGRVVNDPRGPVTGNFGGRRPYALFHSTDAPTLGGGRGTVSRNQFAVEITNLQNPNRNPHRIGRYMLRVTSDGAQTVHLWCSQADGYGFKVDPAPPTPPTPPLPAYVHVEDLSLIGHPGGADNILTVAAYSAEADGDPVAPYSSRGRLVSYGGGPAQPMKPDLAAPGHEIDAAKSRDIARRRPPGETVPMNGTSMSAPHVTGVVALMLGRNPHLTFTQVRDTLRAWGVRSAPPTPWEQVGAGRLDAKNALDHTPP